MHPLVRRFSIPNTTRLVVQHGAGPIPSPAESLLVSPRTYSPTRDDLTSTAAGLFQGAAMIEILPIGRMLFLGFLYVFHWLRKHISNTTRPSFSALGNNALWREIRGYKHYVLIASELAGHGIQIFDMKKVRRWKRSATHSLTIISFSQSILLTPQSISITRLVVV